jgi:subtilisin family serine protease
MDNKLTVVSRGCAAVATSALIAASIYAWFDRPDASPLGVAPSEVSSARRNRPAIPALRTIHPTQPGVRASRRDQRVPSAAGASAPAETLPPAPLTVARTISAQAPALDAIAAAQKLDLNLQSVIRLGDQTTQRVIIETAAGTERQLAHDVASRHTMSIIGASDGRLIAAAKVSDLRWLALHSATTRISTDAAVAAAQSWRFTDGNRLRGALGLRRNGRLLSSSGSFTGDKIVVAVIDSGIELSKDLDEKRVLAFYDFTRTGQAVPTAPFDDYGHGTHVASLIGGSGDLSSDRFQGFAKKTRLVGYKVLDRNGVGYASHVIAAVEHAVAQRDTSASD